MSPSSSLATPSKILVLGLGELGLPVAVHIARLAAQQQPYQPTVSVLLRQSTISKPSASRAKDLETVKGLGLSLVPGDLATATKEELVEIFNQYDCIVNCTGFVGGSETLIKSTQAVLDAGVQTFIPWQFGVDYDQVGYGSPQTLWDTQLDVRRLLRNYTDQKVRDGVEARTRWTIVQTGIFTSFLFEEWFGIVDLREEGKPVVRALGDWGNRVSTTSPDDIGRVTAAAVFAPELRDQIVKSAGDTISYGELADTMEEVLRQKVTRERLTLDFLEQDLKNHPDDNIKMYQLAFAQGTGCSWDLDSTINRSKGMKLQTVREFALEKFQSTGS